MLTHVAHSEGSAAAFKQLLTERAPRTSKAVFVDTWGLVEGTDGDLILSLEAAKGNPLLAVMLARLQEGCRLMWASGRAPCDRCRCIQFHEADGFLFHC